MLLAGVNFTSALRVRSGETLSNQWGHDRRLAQHLVSTFLFISFSSFFFFFPLAQHLISTFSSNSLPNLNLIFFTLIRYNIISVIFLGIFAIPNIGVKWLSYVLPFSCFSVLPIMLLVKEEYRRRTVDDEEKEEADEEGDSGILSEEEK